MLKDRDYDVTSYIILILSLTLTQNGRGGQRKFARCIVDMVGEECEVKMVDEEWPVGETLVVVSSVTWSVQW